MTTTHEADLADITSTIWATLFERALERGDDDVVGTESTVTSIVHIEGAWQGAVILRCPQLLSATLTSEMLGGESVPTFDDIRDALGELTNMVAGNLKAMLAGAELHLAARRRARVRLRGRRARRVRGRAGVVRLRRTSRGRDARAANHRQPRGRTMNDAQSESAPRAPDRVAMPTVLVVDDSVAIRRILGRALEGSGYRVEEAANGREALELCHADAPDLVLLDVDMPVLDGLSTLRAMKDDARLRAIPVLFLTARTGGDDVAAGLALGAQDYLRKPCDPVELRARVEHRVTQPGPQGTARAGDSEVPRAQRHRLAHGARQPAAIRGAHGGAHASARSRPPGRRADDRR